MTGLWIGLAEVKSLEEIARLFQGWFPALSIGSYDQLMSSASSNWPAVVLRLAATPSEFPTVVSVEIFPGPQEEGQIMPVMIELARRLAETFGCRTICDGSGYGDSQSPYWAIIWDADRAYLADDCETLFADGEGGAVKIIRELAVVRAQLTENGRLQA